MKKLFSLLAILVAGYFVFRPEKSASLPTIPSSLKESASNSTSNFICAGKTRCSQMSSCDEAKYYLKNCPNVEIDGDGDGIPCEDQLCGH